MSFCRIPTAQWLNRLETSKNKLTDFPQIPTILILSTINSKVDCFIFYQRTLRMIVSAPALCTGGQATAGGCWCPEAGSGCRVSDVQPGLETRGRPKPQGLILAPDLETGDCEDWAAEAGVWPPVTICILQPRPMRGQDWGHVI